jgi:antitoxin YokJ
MTAIEALLRDLHGMSDCETRSPSGLPAIEHPHRIPDDALEFFQLCGGVRLFAGGEYSISVVSPSEVVKANPVIVGMDCPDDISDSWYVIADCKNRQLLSIDCHPDRLGRIYESFWDCHGVAGSCPIVALSLTELLSRLIESRGGYWYWLRREFAGYGDAYGTRASP